MNRQFIVFLIQYPLRNDDRCPWRLIGLMSSFHLADSWLTSASVAVRVLDFATEFVPSVGSFCSWLPVETFDCIYRYRTPTVLVCACRDWPGLSLSQQRTTVPYHWQASSNHSVQTWTRTPFATPPFCPKFSKCPSSRRPLVYWRSCSMSRNTC